MKKILFSILSMQLSFFSFANDNSELTMQVIPVAQGAWVKLSDKNKPVSGASIQILGQVAENKTGSSGLSFVRNENMQSYQGIYVAKLKDGREISRKALIMRDHND